VYRVYCAQVTKLQRGRELRLSVICPRGDLVDLTVLTSGQEVWYCVTTLVVGAECVASLGLITLLSSHDPEPCAVRDGATA
jgi:hypothetical protein